MDTWISLHRKFLDWQWYKNQNVKILFLHLLLKANYKDNLWQDIVVRRGQLITSIKNLSKETGLTEQQTKTALSKLKSTNEITIKSTNKYSLITIVKYNFYQKSDKRITNKTTSEITNEQQTNNKQITTNNNINNINNIYSYFINKSNEKNPRTFNEKMKFLNEIQKDAEYSKLTPNEEYELRNYILTR